MTNGRVLVVDDDVRFRALVLLLLAQAGVEATEAASGAEALEAARQAAPAVVILDVVLPDVSGYEVCRALRDELGDGPAILFVSGERVQPLDRAAGLLIGGDDYLVKPVDPNELLARVRRLLARSYKGVREPREREPEFGLTQRELEVLRLLAAGRRPAQIASELVIAPKTVAAHVQRILTKLRVNSRVQAVALAYESGLVPRGPADDVLAHGTAHG